MFQNKAKEDHGLSDVEHARNEIVTKELLCNPYCDQLLYKSVTANAFIKDGQGNIVNKYQKPLSLYLRLLKMFVNPGDLVLDLTCGTAMLALAACEKDAPQHLEIIGLDKNHYQCTNALKNMRFACTRPTAVDHISNDATAENN